MEPESGPIQGSPTLEAADGAATLIIGQNVRAGCEDEYLKWQKQVTAAASRYPGFRGADFRRPTAVQSDWSTVYQFDSVANVKNWRILHTDYRRPLGSFATTISAAIGLLFYSLA